MTQHKVMQSSSELLLSKIKQVTELIMYLFKINNRNTGKRCEICSKLTIKTPERRH